LVCIDAYKEGIGGILTHNGHVVFYESINIKKHGNNYVTHDLELVNIVHALKIWRQYLMGRKFELRIDHSGLKYLFEQQNLNSRNKMVEFSL
jgi:hypothetical protein